MLGGVLGTWGEPLSTVRLQREGDVMEPIPESLEALTKLSVGGDVGLVQRLSEAAARVVHLVPECVALSIALFDDDLTFTLLATSDRMRIVDAAQYLDGGPCELSARSSADVAVDDILDEDRWQLFALATAATGVRSSLSLPLRDGAAVVGSINFYARTDYAFIGRQRTLAQMFGATVEEAVANADLSMGSLERARQAVQTLEDRDTITTAVGVHAARHALTVSEAYDNLHDAAERAGVPLIELARLVLKQRVSY
jgi:GAF domain-containing protein